MSKQRWLFQHATLQLSRAIPMFIPIEINGFCQCTTVNVYTVYNIT